MQYFFLEKQSPLTQRWKVRQVAFDARYRYLYYSAPVSQSDLEAAAAAAAVAEVNGTEEENVPLVSWRMKLKLTALDYMADDYCVPPTSPDFKEKLLLTLLVSGYERKLERPAQKPKKTLSRLLGFGASGSASSAMARSESSRCGGGGGGGYTAVATRDPLEGVGGRSRSTNVGLTSDEMDAPPPELPSLELHLEGYDVGTVHNQEDVEDEDENLFRDIELVPDSNPDDLDDVEESEEDEEDEEDEMVLKSPTTRALSEVASEERSSFYSFGSNPRSGKKVTLALRARNYDAFRIVSLRLRQALVRHGLCSPLHRGLPPYDPRNGIAFATVPLHLRCQFRRLNDVVFYSFQCGHAVYVRHLREVRGLSGYLCITHDSVLLLQADGKCPRWVDLEDIIGIDYVLQGSHSFVSILAVEPMPDFIFIPIFPSYPLASSFDAEAAVEGIVGMLRRLLMQRMRADEDVSLAPLPKHEDLDADNASDVDDYDALCHIRDLTERYADVFRYISQNGAGRPLQWKWDNSKTPKHFTYKKDLAAALKRDEDDEDRESDGDDAADREGVFPTQKAPKVRAAGSGSFAVSSFTSATSIAPATVAQLLLAPPSDAAELRARERLRVTRTDPERREMKRALSPQSRPAPVTVAAVAAVAAAGGTSSSPAPQPTPSTKPESYGLVHAHRAPGTGSAAEMAPQMVPAVKGARLPANAPSVTALASGPGSSSGGGGRASSPRSSGSEKASQVSPAGRRSSASGSVVLNVSPSRHSPTAAGAARHADPRKALSPTKRCSVPPTAPAAALSSEDDEDEEADEEEDDDVFDSEDVDDLLEEPSLDAQHRSPPPRQAVKLRKKRGQPAPDHVSAGDDDGEESSSSSDEETGAALPAGRTPPVHAQAAPMPTPTLQANTKLATDFLQKAASSTSPQPPPALPPPALPPPQQQQ